MTSQTNSYPTPPSSATPRGWWSRPIMTVQLANDDRQITFKEFAAMITPFCGGLFTVIVVFLIFLFIDKAHSHAKISIQSIAVSSDTWQIDFLMKIPSSRYSIYYDDDATVKLGALNAAVLNVTRKRDSRDDHAAFSLAFVAEEGNRSDVVSEELDVNLRAKHRRYVDSNEAGHFNIRCQNLTRSREKIICQSSFTSLKITL